MYVVVYCWSNDKYRSRINVFNPLNTVVNRLNLHISFVALYIHVHYIIYTYRYSNTTHL